MHIQGDEIRLSNDLIDLGSPQEPGAIGFEDLLNPEKKDPRGPGGAGGGGGGGGGGGLQEPPPFQPGTSGYYPGVSTILWNFFPPNFFDI